MQQCLYYVSWAQSSILKLKETTQVARSSTKAECRLVAATTAELSWVCSLLTELGVTIPQVPVVHCDNIGATYLCSNQVFHCSMKYVALDYRFIRDQVQSDALRMAYVSSEDLLADALIKPFSRERFLKLRTKIGLSPQSFILQGYIGECT